jgi:hypothetical protein
VNIKFKLRKIWAIVFLIIYTTLLFKEPAAEIVLLLLLFICFSYLTLGHKGFMLRFQPTDGRINTESRQIGLLFKD